MTLLSPHFSLEEMTFSEVALRKGIPNIPAAEAIENLKRLCTDLLEPTRTLLGEPLHVNSGYRSPPLNKLIGGAIISAHTYGRAADFVPTNMPLLDAFEILRTSTIPFDQIIFECAAWIHIAIASEDIVPRRQVLTATGSPGRWKYERVT